MNGQAMMNDRKRSKAGRISRSFRIKVRKADESKIACAGRQEFCQRDLSIISVARIAGWVRSLMRIPAMNRWAISVVRCADSNLLRPDRFLRLLFNRSLRRFRLRCQRRVC